MGCVVQLAKLAHLSWMHIRIAGKVRRTFKIRWTSLVETLALDLPGGFDPGLNICRRLSEAVIAELLVIHPGDFDMNVDTV